jgi:hypothetical protein
MAYMSQEMKKKLAPAIKAVMKEFGVKGTISVDNHSTIVVSIKEGSVDFGRDNLQIHHSHGSQFAGKTRVFIEKIFAAMRGNEWYDNSDSMSDYFDTAYYMRVYVGNYDKPYKVVA